MMALTWERQKISPKISPITPMHTLCITIHEERNSINCKLENVVTFTMNEFDFKVKS